MHLLLRNSLTRSLHRMPNSHDLLPTSSSPHPTLPFSPTTGTVLGFEYPFKILTSIIQSKKCQTMLQILKDAKKYSFLASILVQIRDRSLVTSLCSVRSVDSHTPAMFLLHSSRSHEIRCFLYSRHHKQTF